MLNVPVCRLSSKLVSTIHAQTESVLCVAKVEQAMRPALKMIFWARSRIPTHFVSGLIAACSQADF